MHYTLVFDFDKDSREEAIAEVEEAIKPLCTDPSTLWKYRLDETGGDFPVVVTSGKHKMPTFPPPPPQTHEHTDGTVHAH